MNAFPATYFDGNTARPQPVTLAFSHDGTAPVCELTGDNLNLRHPVSDLTLAPPTGSARRFLYLPGGASCEFDAIDGLDTAFCPARASGGLLRTLEKNAAIVTVFTVLLVAAAVGGVQWALPFLASKAAEAIPVSLERRLGNGTLAMLDQQIFQSSRLSNKKREEIKSLFDEIAYRSGHSTAIYLKFRRMYDGSANAFALPDGTIVITDRLVELASSNDELVAIIAHELGHLHHRHSLRQLLQNSITLLLVTSVTGDTSAIGNFAGALPLVVLSAKYSRDHEREADAFALKTMQATNVPPGAFIRIMTRIDQDTRRIHKDTPPPFLSTHPPTEERLETYRQAEAALPPP
jgi:predicted Zn-dependent protease